MYFLNDFARFKEIEMSLSFISQQLAIYVGFIFLIAGIIGNGINIFIFANVQNYRRVPCTFYLLIESIADVLHISINLSSRIASLGFGFDLTRTSALWCKTRNFFIGFFSIISLSCACMATIDQFFATSQIHRLRQFSTIQLAHKIVCVLIVVWGIIEIINSFCFYNISPMTDICMPISAGHAFYISIFTLVFLAAIPLSLMVLFGYMTYRNIRRTRTLADQHADRQLIKMVLLKVAIVVISLTPFNINSIYGLITADVSKDADRQSKENFTSTMGSLLTYLYYTVYLFYFSSDNSIFFFCLFLGEFLHILDFIQSLSPYSEKSNILLATTKSSYSTSDTLI